MSTNRALIVVDVQPTFCEGGALGVEGGNAVAERIAEFVGSHRGDYDLVVTTQDWHIDPGDHFSDTPDFVDSWPPHGVAGTPEAELHPALAGLDADHGIKKGQYEAPTPASRVRTKTAMISRRSSTRRRSRRWTSWGSPNPTACCAPPSTRLMRGCGCACSPT